jgi:septum formation protein
MAVQQVVLASQSTRRKQLLEWAEIPFDIIVSATDESYPPGLSTEAIPVHIARQKALAVRNSAEYKRYEGNTTIVAADTVVVLDNTIIGKPVNREDAIDILGRLSGQKHLVITGVVILKESREIAFADTTEVWFHPLTPEQITFYVDKYQPYDKAGAYAIQEWIGVTGIERINGDFYNVMGLPVSKVVQHLCEMS